MSADLKCNIDNCTCTYTACLRRGKCCECISYHRGKNEIPGCFFTEAGEKTYDRSIENFIADYKNNK
ncbi:DUF6485 family protein [Thermohalobacter berrensis]|uniref:Cytosolic protein n=1 Tax=Thermohalobacter berrensis TaxID=99594 RepID=A0A419TB53_9FIRM|nr:DUF6485 family protein [Thermohalobacter berrensis]RKD34693.1 hypothetical protein BET03_02385 [Thermohalobacter berrensis]